MLIVLEGIDGSGKGTQSVKLVESLKQKGADVALFAFPRYTITRFGAVVGQYLNGDFGVGVHPKVASTLYACDRFESKHDLEAQLAVRDIVVCDRYVPSNLAHQCAKLNKEEGTKLAHWICDIEYGLFQVPVPDLVICLDLSVESAAKLIEKKAQRAYTEKKADLHECDLEYLKAVRNWYSFLPTSNCSRHRQWEVVSVERNGHLRSVDQVFEDVWQVAESACKDII